MAVKGFRALVGDPGNGAFKIQNENDGGTPAVTVKRVRNCLKLKRMRARRRGKERVSDGNERGCTKAAETGVVLVSVIWGSSRCRSLANTGENSTSYSSC